MIESARLPPIYKLVPLGADDDPLARAKEMLSEGVDPATVLCIDSATLFDCAVILNPDMPFSQAQLVLYVGMLGLGDAIGSVVPAGIDITYRWPNRIDANLGFVAQLQLSAPPGLSRTSVVPWLALRATVAVSGNLAGKQDVNGYETTLVDEGAADLTTTGMLESFSRHFLSWINRWQDDGFSPVRAMWLRHSAETGEEVEISNGTQLFRGIVETVDDDGALILKGADDVNRLTLAEFLDQ